VILAAVDKEDGKNDDSRGECHCLQNVNEIDQAGIPPYPSVKAKDHKNEQLENQNVWKGGIELLPFL